MIFIINVQQFHALTPLYDNFYACLSVFVCTEALSCFAHSPLNTRYTALHKHTADSEILCALYQAELVADSLLLVDN